MDRLWRRVGQGLAALAVLLALAFAFGPREPLDLAPGFDAATPGDDLDAWLAASEAAAGAVPPAMQKRIYWAGPKGARTDWTVVYLHGFSASSEEIRPVPDLVAQGLGANLYYTRLAGHGLGPAAMAGPTAHDWMNDVAEALAIGRRLGERVLVIATSTGGTLAAEAALQPDLAQDMDAIVFVSPNFGLNSPFAGVPTWPFARRWLPLILGRQRCLDPLNELHARFWTLCYPTEAILPMAALTADAAAADYRGVTLPALFLFSRRDRVVAPEATEVVAARWGGAATVEAVTLAPGDDPWSHIIAGDILSPSRTRATADRILGWVAGLPAAR